MTGRGATIELRGVAKSFGRVQAVCDVDLQVAAGEVIVVFGPSGCGKSTLLRCINFLVEPDAGFVFIDGTPMGRVPVNGGARVRRDRERNINRMRADIGVVFQNFNLWPHRTTFENVTEALIRVRGMREEKAEARAMEALDQVGMAAFADRLPARLSGGQQQRVAIARALAMDPKILLLDEPTSSLDPILVNEVLGAIRDLAHQGMTMLIVTHHLGFARQLADRLVFMDHGAILEQGSPDIVLNSPTSDRLKVFLSLILSGAASAEKPSAALSDRAQTLESKMTP